MSIPLLGTKFLIPPLRSQLIRRPRLVDIFTPGLEPTCRLILVCAPAGYGKTTLLREWIQTNTEKNAAGDRLPYQFAWINLDQGDDDLAIFLAYLVAALQKVQPGIGKGLLTGLQNPRPLPVQSLATLLINELTDISSPILLILDDYHLIQSQLINDFLSFLIEHKPATFYLVVSSRAEPALQVARLRARGQLVEVRQRDLEFTYEEMVEFLRKILDIPLSSIQLRALETRTEGWAAGLQLAALSMRNYSDISAFIDSFSGKQDTIADYLADEVLAQQPETVVDFLLKTSILESMVAPLCKAVTGQAQAQETLEYLMQANLFVVPLDGSQEWVRYHPLFADLLQKRLLLYHREQVDEYHRRACRWYEENGFFSQAIEHGLVGKDFDRVGALVARLAEDSLAFGQTVTLIRWLESLPDEIKDRNLILWVYQGLALLMCGKPDVLVRASVKRLGESQAADSIRGEIEFITALRSLMEGKAEEAATRSQIAMQQLPPDRLFFRSLAADTLGMARTLQGDSTAAIQAFELLIDLSNQAGNDMMLILALSHLAGLHTVRGRLRASSALYLRVIEMAEDLFGKHSSYTGKAYLGLGELYREWNDLEAALHSFHESIEAFSRFSGIGLTLTYLSIARIKLTQRDWDGVQDSLQKARHWARESKSTQMDDLMADLMEARFWIVHGDLDLATNWARSIGILDRDPEEIIRSEGGNLAINEFLSGKLLLLARLYLALERPSEALMVVEPLVAKSLMLGHNRRGIEGLILKALALQGQKKTDRAIETIEQALSLGEPEGFLRMFLDEGKPMAQLLYRALERGISPSFIGKILAEFSHAELDGLAKRTQADSNESLVEPLSDREMEVLALIVAGFSNQEIAQKLYISISTVKGHIAHIFGKLGVKSRTQAVSRARDFGLIPHRSSE
jgi:LuxR family transcriptional regulator, maltose regulon positive regulatory protein